ncbi:membrane protein [Longimycelium tulufanense]|uniref:Membrane protein n=1 Tax=Longimycelium tulufanense TaxID=907463 RepID=A0A8J3C6D5_9PSEU|nr:type II CAAX endopeptidase family protein [Longimycelium tulufanense]GGM39853.1 membrane protein [Longimycelium tulufanense]
MNDPQVPDPPDQQPAARQRLLEPSGVDEGPASDEPPRHRWGFGAFLLVEAVFLLASVFVVIPFRPPGANGALSPIGIVVALVVPTVLAAVVALVITRVRGDGPIRDLRIRFSWPDIRLGLALGVIGLVPTLITARLWAWWVGDDNANSAVGSLLDGVRLPPALAALVFLHIWLIAPICEEIVYRGLLWGAMERLRWSRWSAFVLSTAIFTVGHLEPSRTPLLLVVAVPIGLARLLTGRLPASVIAHQVNNFLPALGVLLMVSGVMPA